MQRGLYTGAFGMLTQWTALDVVGNNLANVDTTGYKKDETICKEFGDMYIKRLYDNYIMTPQGPVDLRPTVGYAGTGVGINEIATIFTNGPIRQTQNNLDMAIEGDGFFCIQGPNNEISYTRNGSFSLNNQGYLVTQDGFNVLGEAGPIQINKNNFVVMKGGVIATKEDTDTGWKNPNEIAKLKIVSFDEKRGLIKQGDTLFKATEYAGEPKTLPDPKILQGYLEKANVNPVQEMVKMIELQRIYEINQRTVVSFDDILKIATNEVGRVG